MPLLSLWQTNKEAVGQFTIEQVVATAGKGILIDSSECSKELRAYLSEINSEKIFDYIDQCLSARFDKAGLVLQDLVNELGRRLDYKVINGRYQGTTNSVGADGIWVSPEGHTIVVEVKTTDTYRISLDTIANYRDCLQNQNQIDKNSSILIVVGRRDTGELEAQIRGSRHAWDIRLISAEALIKLVTLKENSDDPETGNKIRSVLMPVEYTRLDRLVDVLFTTATDVEPIITDVESDAIEETLVPANERLQRGTWEFTDSVLLQQKREQIIKSFSNIRGLSLIKKSRALYWSSDHANRVACTISKRYKRGSYPYWYAYHPKWDEFLAEGESGYLILGCMDKEVSFSIPRADIYNLLTNLNVTENDSGKYWHLHLIESNLGLELVVPRAVNFPLSRYKFDLEGITS